MASDTIVTATPQQFHAAMAFLDWCDAGYTKGQPNLRVGALANGRFRHAVVSMSIQRKAGRELSAKQIRWLTEIYATEAPAIKRHTQWEHRNDKPAPQAAPTPIRP